MKSPTRLPRAIRSRLVNRHRRRYLNRREFDDLESRLVWIFGSPRTGSTWLLNMLAEARAPGVATIDETWAGELFNRTLVWHKAGGVAVAVSADAHATLPGWVLAKDREHLWRPVMRALLLEGFTEQLARGQARTDWERPFLVVKEPNTSEAADAIVGVLPNSRLIFLVRDGRDVVDSLLDHFATASWGIPDELGWDRLPAEEREHFVSGTAANWVYRTEAVQRACEVLAPGAALTVRYEDLLADTPRQLERIAAWLGLDAPQGWAAEVVDRHAFERVPAEQRGSGMFHRAATPGLWRENMSPAEQEAVEQVLGDKLRELGYQ